jgi:dethiobiotin synthase
VAEVLFITGTGTGVGKTVLTSLACLYAQECGLRVIALKPFCSGRREDVHLLHRIQGGRVSMRTINPFHYPLPLAPAVAASEGAGRQVGLREAVESVKAHLDENELVLVEGVGGVMVPLGRGFTVLDWIAALRCKVLVAGWNAMGTINHSLLTLGAIQGRGLEVSGMALMKPERPDPSTDFNGRAIHALGGGVRVVEFPFLGRKMNETEAIKRAFKKTKKSLARLIGTVNFTPALSKGNAASGGEKKRRNVLTTPVGKRNLAPQ